MLTKQFPALAVFDLCGTIVRDDTTLGVLNWHFSRLGAQWKRRLVNAVRSRRSPFWFALALAERLSGRAIAKHLLVGLLKGCARDELVLSAKQYVAWAVQSQLVPEVLALLQESVRRGCEPVIASASLEPVVKAFADHFHVRFVASTLDAKDGRFTGVYAEDLAGRKRAALAEKFGEQALNRIALTVSDNLTDLPLMRESTEAIAIAHQDRHARRWRVLGVRVLMVSGV